MKPALSIGWLMALSGEWERGINWVDKAIKLNPYHRHWARYAVCVNWLRLGDYQKAYRETLNFTMTGFFWDHVLKACTCGHIGRIEEGQACVQTLLALKPDFAQRGRKLIRRYIKFEDIVKQVVEGLNAVGIAVR